MAGTRIEDMLYGLKQQGINTDENIDADGTLNVEGAVTLQSTLAITGVLNASTAGIRTEQAVTNVNDTTPTDAELDTAFGVAANLGRGFIGTVDDNDGDTNGFLCWTSDASWYFVKGTKAA